MLLEALGLDVSAVQHRTPFIAFALALAPEPGALHSIVIQASGLALPGLLYIKLSPPESVRSYTRSADSSLSFVRFDDIWSFTILSRLEDL